MTSINNKEEEYKKIIKEALRIAQQAANLEHQRQLLKFQKLYGDKFHTEGMAAYQKYIEECDQNLADMLERAQNDSKRNSFHGDE